ncbi:hypothetical protein L6452_20702 [Arctium lappa]|uniref:Uncharacterized protein n=1 Tax=Arctium lappa TaxID=4217 RepID=A0ACB9BBB4_ARCLA|nr:hypothetical protein L6452_20702 [Arctium lappa]
MAPKSKKAEYPAFTNFTIKVAVKERSWPRTVTRLLNNVEGGYDGYGYPRYGRNYDAYNHLEFAGNACACNGNQIEMPKTLEKSDSASTSTSTKSRFQKLSSMISCVNGFDC